jgi:hypothetical protein
MIGILDRVRIRTPRDAGHRLEEIAATVGVGKRSVQRILKVSDKVSALSYLWRCKTRAVRARVGSHRAWL